MRDFKFRLWDDRNKKFGYLQIRANLVSWPNNIWMSQNNIGEAVRFDDVTDWQQFTGLKDKNGKEIWEGDLLRVQSQYETDEPIDSSPNKVYFRDGAFRCGFHDMILGQKVCTGSEGNWNCEVIGNIYQNPELVKS